jgi:hypothetical protein
VHLVTNYRPSQPTGWPGATPERAGRTIGGHTSFKEFVFTGKRYRISLLSFGRSGAAPDPVYEHLPADATIDFKRTLAKAFDDDYSFRYTGGFKGREEISVQSYSVFVNEPTAQSPEIVYGADLYLVYNPDPRRAHPRGDGDLRWIQVVTWRGTGAPPSSGPYVDNLGRANPFYMTGGLTSIYGRQVFNFAYNVDVPTSQGPGPSQGPPSQGPPSQGSGPSQGPSGSAGLSERYMAEVFLAGETKTKDGRGKAVIEVFGGVKYGWQVAEVLG